MVRRSKNAGRRSIERGAAFIQIISLVALFGFVAGGMMMATGDTLLSTAKGGGESMNASTLGAGRGTFSGGAGSFAGRPVADNDNNIVGGTTSEGLGGNEEEGDRGLVLPCFETGQDADGGSDVAHPCASSGGADAGGPAEERSFFDALANVTANYAGYVITAPFQSAEENDAFAKAGAGKVGDAVTDVASGAWGIITGAFDYVTDPDFRSDVNIKVGDAVVAGIDYAEGAIEDPAKAWDDAKRVADDATDKVKAGVFNADDIVRNGTDVEKATLYGGISGEVAVSVAEVAIGVATAGAGNAALKGTKLGQLIPGGGKKGLNEESNEPPPTASETVNLEAPPIKPITPVSSPSSSAAKGGAQNIANGPRLAAQLTKQEASAVFTKSGALHPEVIAGARPVIPGTALKNQGLVGRLTADGSNIADWAKMSSQSFKSPAGSFQVHFYQNLKTGAVHYGDDFKAVFNHGGNWP